MPLDGTKKVRTPEQEAQNRRTDEALAKLPRKMRIELLRAELKRPGPEGANEELTLTGQTPDEVKAQEKGRRDAEEAAKANTVPGLMVFK